MRKYFLPLIFFLILQSANVKGQSEVIIKGTITDAVNDSVFLLIDKHYLGQPPEKKSILAVNGSFEFRFNPDGKRVCELMFHKQKISLFVEPGYNFTISFESDRLHKTSVFSGKGGDENKMFKLFYAQLAGNFSEEKMKEHISSMNIDAYEDKLFEDKNNFFSLYKVYPGRTTLSSGLLMFLEGEITYSYYRWLLAYPFIKTNSSGEKTIPPLPSAMADIFQEGQFNNDNMMPSESYREFMIWLNKYQALKSNSFNPYPSWTSFVTKQNQNALTSLKGNSYLYWLSRTIYNECDSIKTETLSVYFKTIQAKDTKGEMYKLVSKKCAGAGKKATPSPKIQEQNSSPKKSSTDYPFKLQGLDGKEFSIEDFKGKVIYVDFWASWCGPCRAQFPYSKALHEKFSEKQLKSIVFMYISIDDNVEVWKNAVEKNDLNGVNGHSPGGWSSEVCKFFGISSIPRYMLIEKSGKISNDNAPRPADDAIYQEILKLLE